jgi:hypothetical protein
MSIFGFIGQAAKLPFSAISDLSSAVQGKEPDSVASNFESIGEEIADMLDPD